MLRNTSISGRNFNAVSGEQLLLLAILSDAQTKRQINRELDQRAIRQRFSQHVVRQPMQMRLAA